ncbi:MAG TPA: hypothetical protein VIU40_00650 [Geobacteraceae bacterium]
MIKVIYINQSCGTVEDHHLEGLIATGKVAAFCRSGDWIFIGRDPIRGMGGAYCGPDRRKKEDKTLATPSSFFG